jgi:hypothetical protein
MFNDEWFYNKSLRKVITVFGTVFNNITVKRIDSSGGEVERFKLPISYGPKERWVYRTEQNSAVDNQRSPASQPIQSDEPRISYTMTSLQYDGERKLSKINKIIKPTNTDKVLRQFNPVAYEIGFDLFIISKFTDEALQIVEQILPYFTPNLTVQYIPIQELNLRDDLHITLTGVSFEDNWEDDWVTKRNIIWTLNFTAKMNFYGPILEQGIIREVITNVHANVPLNEYGEIETSMENLHKIPRVQRLTVTPDPITAGPTDDYGFTEVWEDFNDGRRYDPITGTDVDVDE